MGGNFREKLNKALRIKFRGFKFRSTMGGNMNFNLLTRVRSVQRFGSGLFVRGYHVHEAIWEASQCDNSICADRFTVTAAFRSTRERQQSHILLVSPPSSLRSLLRVSTQLRRNLWMWGTVNRVQQRNRALHKQQYQQFIAQVENVVGAKFRDPWVPYFLDQTSLSISCRSRILAPPPNVLNEIVATHEQQPWLIFEYIARVHVNEPLDSTI